MSHRWFTALGLAAAVSFLAGQPAYSQPKPRVTVNGVVVGRSGKPMAKARLTIGEVRGDEEVTVARIKFPASIPSVLTDDQGRFQIKNVPAGEYTILYQPGGASTVLPVEISVKSLTAVERSITPGLRTELGKNDPYAPRPWGKQFTLMKGHTFMSEGNYMRIWNATLRRGEQGPYVEVRRGVVWLARFEEGAQIKLEAWSF